MDYSNHCTPACPLQVSGDILNDKAVPPHVIALFSWQFLAGCEEKLVLLVFIK